MKIVIIFLIGALLLSSELLSIENNSNKFILSELPKPDSNYEEIDYIEYYKSLLDNKYNPDSYQKLIFDYDDLKRTKAIFSYTSLKDTVLPEYLRTRKYHYKFDYDSNHKVIIYDVFYKIFHSNGNLKSKTVSYDNGDKIEEYYDTLGRIIKYSGSRKHPGDPNMRYFYNYSIYKYNLDTVFLVTEITDPYAHDYDKFQYSTFEYRILNNTKQIIKRTEGNLYKDVYKEIIKLDTLFITDYNYIGIKDTLTTIYKIDTINKVVNFHQKREVKYDKYDSLVYEKIIENRNGDTAVTKEIEHIYTYSSDELLLKYEFIDRLKDISKKILRENYKYNNFNKPEKITFYGDYAFWEYNYDYTSKGNLHKFGYVLFIVDSLNYKKPNFNEYYYINRIYPKIKIYPDNSNILELKSSEVLITYKSIIKDTIDLPIDTLDNPVDTIKYNDNKNIKFLFFPNPSNGIFNLAINDLNINENFVVEIYNYYGQLLKNIDLKLTSKGEKNLQLDISEFGIGQYYVRIIGKDFKDEQIITIVK